MVNSQASWGFTITHYDKSNSWATQDLSTDGYPKIFTDTGDGKVNSCVIRLEALNGQYIQSGVNSKTQILVNDRIRVVGDDGSSGAYNRVFDVIKITPIKSTQEGVMVELTCLGIERWLQKANYSRNTFNRTPHNMFNDLVVQYNAYAAISTDTPTINLSSGEISVNELPTSIRLQQGWGNNEETIFNRMNELVDLMAAPHASGGILDFFDIRFVSSVSNVTSFDIEVFSSGDTNRSKPSITLNSTEINLEEETDGGLEEPESLLVNNWGANGEGTLPTNFSKFSARQQLMPDAVGSHSLFSEWESGVTYEEDSIVKYTATAPTNDKVYRAQRETQGDTPPASTSLDWDELTIEAYYGTIKYSPWTDGRQTEWQNGAADPQNNSTFGTSMWDANINIRSNDVTRVWCDVSYNDPANIPSQWLYQGTTLYDGLRCLVQGAGAPASVFANYSNYIMEYDGETSLWKPKYELVSKQLVVVLDEAKVYKYTATGTYSDFTTAHNGLDCFHPMVGNTVINTTSMIQNRDVTPGSVTNFTGNINSAIQARFRYTPLINWIDEWLPQIRTGLQYVTGVGGTLLNMVWPSGGGNRDSADWYSAGAWLSFRWPFPKNSYNIVGGSTGDIYGGSTTTNIVPSVDSQNMTYTANGKRGFNHGTDSEDYGPLSSIDFMMRMDFFAQELITGDQYRLTKANFKMTCYLVDKNDNTVKQDFVIPFNGENAAVTLPLSGFEIYRAQRPIYETTFFTDALIPPKEIPSTAQFEWRHIAMMSIQLQESYDESGRYKGASGNNIGTGNLFFDKGDFEWFELDITIDALRFSKPALANSGAITGLHNEGVFIQSPDISNYEQLKNNATAELQKATFQKKQYDLKTEGEFNIEFGDYFVFEDEDIVEDTYNGNANQILLVAKHIEYEFTKGEGGTGGYKRRIIGAKRFT